MLLKNPAKELHEILKKASEMSPESEAIGVLMTSVGISTESDLENIVMDGWVRIFGLIYNCREILQRLNENNIVIETYTTAINTVGTDVSRWMERCLKVKNNASEKILWKSIPHLNNPKYLPVQTIGMLSLDLDKNNLIINENKLELICNIIKDAINRLKLISKEEVDLGTRDKVIHELEILLKSIQNKTINNSDEVKGKISSIFLDVFETRKKIMPILNLILFVYNSVTLVVNVPDTLEKTYSLPENISETLLEPVQEMTAKIETLIESQPQLPPGDSITQD